MNAKIIVTLALPATMVLCGCELHATAAPQASAAPSAISQENESLSPKLQTPSAAPSTQSDENGEVVDLSLG